MQPQLRSLNKLSNVNAKDKPKPVVNPQPVPSNASRASLTDLNSKPKDTGKDQQKGESSMKTSQDFLSFCDTVGIYNQAVREGVKYDEKRLYNKPSFMQKTFNESIGIWVDTFKSTDETLDKEKKKLRFSAVTQRSRRRRRREQAGLRDRAVRERHVCGQVQHEQKRNGCWCSCAG